MLMDDGEVPLVIRVPTKMVDYRQVTKMTERRSSLPNLRNLAQPAGEEAKELEGNMATLIS